ncbi:MAG: hypothetical protein J7L71_03680, partial [Spirochaetaceae bacterium]|nr:hypothetical protein [Spirochaetaceae bacterium]
MKFYLITLFLILSIPIALFATAPIVTFRDDGILLVNGNPFFPIQFTRPVLDTFRTHYSGTLSSICGITSGEDRRCDDTNIRSEYDLYPTTSATTDDMFDVMAAKGFNFLNCWSSLNSFVGGHSGENTIRPNTSSNFFMRSDPDEPPDNMGGPCEFYDNPAGITRNNTECSENDMYFIADFTPWMPNEKDNSEPIPYPWSTAKDMDGVDTIDCYCYNTDRWYDTDGDGVLDSVVEGFEILNMNDDLRDIAKSNIQTWASDFSSFIGYNTFEEIGWICPGRDSWWRDPDYSGTTTNEYCGDWFKAWRRYAKISYDFIQDYDPTRIAVMGIVPYTSISTKTSRIGDFYNTMNERKNAYINHNKRFALYSDVVINDYYGFRGESDCWEELDLVSNLELFYDYPSRKGFLDYPKLFYKEILPWTIDAKEDSGYIKRTIPYWCYLAAYGGWRENIDIDGDHITDCTEDLSYYPYSVLKFRYSHYGSIINHVTGICTYGYDWQTNTTIRNNLESVLTELKALNGGTYGDVLTARESPFAPVFGYSRSSDDTLECLVKRNLDDGYDYLFVINRSKDVSFTGASACTLRGFYPHVDEDIEVLFETVSGSPRTVSIECGEFVDEFDESEVHIYRIPSTYFPDGFVCSHGLGTQKDAVYPVYLPSRTLQYGVVASFTYPSHMATGCDFEYTKWTYQWDGSAENTICWGPSVYNITFVPSSCWNWVTIRFYFGDDTNWKLFNEERFYVIPELVVYDPDITPYDPDLEIPYSDDESWVSCMSILPSGTGSGGFGEIDLDRALLPLHFPLKDTTLFQMKLSNTNDGIDTYIDMMRMRTISHPNTYSACIMKDDSIGVYRFSEFVWPSLAYIENSDTVTYKINEVNPRMLEVDSSASLIIEFDEIASSIELVVNSPLLGPDSSKMVVSYKKTDQAQTWIVADTILPRLQSGVLNLVPLPDTVYSVKISWDSAMLMNFVALDTFDTTGYIDSTITISGAINEDSTNIISLLTTWDSTLIHIGIY